MWWSTQSLWHSQQGRNRCFSGTLAFPIKQQMLAIWPLVPLTFLHPARTSGSSQFMYCWSLAWRILRIPIPASVKQEMARVNINILGISKLKWTGMGEFNSGDHYIYYYGQESLRRNWVAIIVNKTVQNAVLGCSLRNDRMISVHFQGKPFNITVIQVCAPTSNAEEAELEQF